THDGDACVVAELEHFDDFAASTFVRRAENQVSARDMDVDWSGRRIEHSDGGIVATHHGGAKRCGEVRDATVRCRREIERVLGARRAVAKCVAAARVGPYGIEWTSAIGSDPMEHHADARGWPWSFRGSAHHASVRPALRRL